MQSLGFPQLVSKATHIRGVCLDHIYIMMMMMMTMMMMIMMNCFCGMVDRRQAFSLISSQEDCQRSSLLRISDKPRAGFWACAEPEFRLSLMRLCSSNNHSPHRHGTTNKEVFTILTMIQCFCTKKLNVSYESFMIKNYLFIWQSYNKTFWFLTTFVLFPSLLCCLHRSWIQYHQKKYLEFLSFIYLFIYLFILLCLLYVYIYIYS